MAELRCPMCSKLNPDDLEFCQFCDARLKPLVGSSQENLHHIRAGEKPTKRQTSEFEKVKFGGSPPIHSGEQPTRKDTGELERSLPSWLKSLRESGEPPSEETSAKADQPEKPKAAPAGGASGEPLDWLDGLESAGHQEEDSEFPDWLAGLRSASTAGSEPGSTPTSAPENVHPDPSWLSRLGGEEAGQPASMPPSKPSSTTPEKTAELSPDFLLRLRPEDIAPAPAKAGTPPASTAKLTEEPPAEAVPAENIPDWLEALKSKAGTFEEQPAASTDETPGWLSSLPSVPEETPSAEPAVLPDWLSSLKGIPTSSEPESAPAQPTPGAVTPDWLRNLQSNAMQQEPEAAPAQPISELETPDWLNSLKAQAAAQKPETAAPPQPASGEETPDWLASLSAKAAAPASSVFIGESAAERAVPAQIPDWLSKLQSDVSQASQAEKGAEEFETSAEPLPVEKSSEPVPDWLSNIEQEGGPAGGTPALVVTGEESQSSDAGQAAFSLETPDWLSKLRPERKTDAPASSGEEAEAGSLETAELPSWVQAMRPVESVIPDAGLSAHENLGTAEASGPLAGLHSVLPASPLAGTMRKPPAYAVKLQVSSNQQKYAAQLEKMVVDEGQVRPLKPERFISNRMWRLVISLVLILAVAFPLLQTGTLTPDMVLYPSEWGETSRLLSEFPADTSMLLVIDYDPALSGELEAAAAPVIDHILYRGTRLALISTTPTGPALAGQFLESTQKYHLDHGLQYTNLGYLAGGPAGIQLFAANPTAAVTLSVEGSPAWETPALQGVTRLSDFAAVIVMTDNADTGRLWIEQTSSAIGDTPLLMIISAQAEPMIRPYYDSGQIQGLVTGLVGGKVYEQTYNTPGLARRYWDSFGFGSLAAVILIVIGGGAGALSSLRPRKKVR